jgi:repressor LexA
MPSTTHLTRPIYTFIRDYHGRHGVSPTIREIQEAVGISSTSVVAYHIDKLIRLGQLRRVHARPAARNVIPTHVKERP